MKRLSYVFCVCFTPALACILSCGLMHSAVAADYYLNVDESKTDYGAFTNATCWIDSAGVPQTEWDTEGVYYVSTTNVQNTTHKTMYLRTPAVEGPVTFPGGQLVLLGNYNANKESHISVFTTGGGAVFPSGILLKGYSRISAASSGGVGENPGTVDNPYVIVGDLTTTVGDGGTVPMVWASASGRAIAIRGRILHSDSKRSMKIYAGSADRGNFTVDLGGSLSNYTGQLDICVPTDYVSCDYGLRTVFSTSTFGGKIYPHRNDMYADRAIPLEFAIARCDDVFSVAQFGVNHSGGKSEEKTKANLNFSLQNGMVFEFPVDGASGKSGQFVVTTTLCAWYESPTNVVIRLVGNAVGSVTNKFATLSVPKAASISEENFTLETDIVPWIKPRLTVEENGAYKTVYVTVPPPAVDPIYLVLTDNQSHSGTDDKSAFTNATSWSSGIAPETGNVYVIAGTNDALMAARTPGRSPYTFPDGASLYLWGQARIQTKVSALTFDDLHSFDGVLGKNMKYDSNNKATTGIYKILNAEDITTVSGNITVESGYFSFGCFHEQTFAIDAKLHGTGTVAFSGMYVIDRDLGNYVLIGANDDFYGKMRVCTAYTGGYTPSYTSYSKLWISDPRSLGADLESPTADALQFTQYSRLVATNSFTIAAGSNRGVTIEDNAVFQISEGAVVRIETPLTISGNLYKENGGVLALAGEANASTGADYIIVTNGTIQLAGSNSVAGLTVRLAAGTMLAVEPGIGDKGVDLTTTTIELDESFSGVLPLCRDSVAATRSMQTSAADIPLFTVNTSDKTAFRAMLPQRPPRFYAASSSKWNDPVDDSEAGTTTFSVHVAHVGMTLSFR